MKKASFFKLPLLLAFAYWLMGLIITFGMIFIRTNDLMNSYSQSMAVFIGFSVAQIPNLLLLIVILACSLYSYAVNELTTKNVLLLILIALTINIVVFLFNHFITPIFIQFYLSNIAQYYDSILMFSYQFVIALAKYIVIGLICFWAVMGFKNMFNRNINQKLLQQSNSAKIHLTLFILLFISMSSLFLVPLVFSLLSHNQDNSAYQAMLWFLVFSMIFILMLVFVVRTCFDYAFDSLQIAKMIKSTVLVLIVSAVAIIVIAGLTAFIITKIPYHYFVLNQKLMLLIVLFEIFIQCVFVFFIARVCTKRYFSSGFNATAQ
ncbi:hypothetical protein DES39_1057 [Orbus hercynius]|uniref:Uncharacterized protein n=1 Tax=Orbus hercynius TaxID=593135 RepID=A0A495RJU2_9GAMM|nr:hypothetical protein [Orbus hercynius]RKS87812.1 hypothetical protein DES39_1057 [Orbus hercynius]